MRNRFAKWLAYRLPYRLAAYTVMRVAVRLEWIRLTEAKKPATPEDVIRGLEQRTVASLLDQMTLRRSDRVTHLCDVCGQDAPTPRCMFCRVNVGEAKRASGDA